MELLRRIRYGYRISALVCFYFLALIPGSLAAKDFATLEQEIQQYDTQLQELESDLGPYHFLLLEPLQQLVRSQVEANRFEDAYRNADRALQIVRISEGLYSPRQYQFLELAVEVDLARSNWGAINKRLERYEQLISTAFDGSPENQIAHLQWLVDVHFDGVVADLDENRATHLIRATAANEFAVRLAQREHLTHTPVYPELLHSLTLAYFLETRGIMSGGGTSYALRKIHPDLDFVEEKGEAIELRYLVGLEKLVMLKDALLRMPARDDIALAMTDVYIADWNFIFDKSGDSLEDYQQAVSSLQAAGIDSASIDRFFKLPVPLPRMSLELDFKTALASLDHGSGSDFNSSMQLGAESFPVQRVIEVTDALPGFVEQGPALRFSEQSAAWHTVTLALDIDPHQSKLARNSGFRTRSLAIPSKLEVIASEAASQKSLRRLLGRVGSIPFRPAMLNAQPVEKTLLIDYQFRDGGVSAASTALSLR